jgi:hypothetical protein
MHGLSSTWPAKWCNINRKGNDLEHSGNPLLSLTEEVFGVVSSTLKSESVAKGSPLMVLSVLVLLFPHPCSIFLSQVDPIEQLHTYQTTAFCQVGALLSLLMLVSVMLPLWGCCSTCRVRGLLLLSLLLPVSACKHVVRAGEAGCSCP